jgi:hypothetical protein
MCYRGWKRFLRIFRGEHDIWSLFCCRGPIACLHQHPKGGARLRAERGRNRAFVDEITHIEQGPAWWRVGNRGQKAKTATILPKWPPASRVATVLVAVSPRWRRAVRLQARERPLAPPVTEERSLADPHTGMSGARSGRPEIPAHRDGPPPCLC